MEKSKKILQFTGERVIPGMCDKTLLQAHWARYKFISEYIKDKIVLDAGCGTGYGTHYLANKAKIAIGIDISMEAIEYAKEHYERDNLKYMIMDCVNPAFGNDRFDIICSFEVIEHIHEYTRYLVEMKKILSLQGIFILSTPNKDIYSSCSCVKDPYHVKDFNLDEFSNLLHKFFGKVELYGQRIRSNITVHEEKQNYLLNLLTKLDVFKIRRAFSKRTRNKVESKIASVTPTSLSRNLIAEDFEFSIRNIDKASYFVAVCKENV